MGTKAVKYETNTGKVYRIRVSDNTIAAAGNTAITAAYTDDQVFVFASNPGSKRKKAFNARGLVLGRTVGTAPNTFIRRTFLPVFSQQVWLDTEVDDPISIGSVAYTVVGKIDEA